MGALSGFGGWRGVGSWFRAGGRAASGPTRRRAAAWAGQIDRLEARQLLSGDVVISEFMAVNGRTLPDQDGEYSDWVELHNTTAAPVNLDGWYLTDNAAELTQWRIPAVTLAPDGYLIVFASEKDRAVAGQQLHTNFKLSGDGEYLGLVEPDGVTVAYDFGPAYPPQEGDVSYGTAPAGPQVAPLVSAPADGKVLVPADGALGDAWTRAGFDDSGWTAGKTGAGFEIGQEGPPALPEETEPNDTPATGNDANANFVGFPGVDQGLYQLGIKGNITTGDGDFFSLGNLQAGDVLTVAQSAASSSRGTLSDSYLELYRVNGTAPILIAVSDDDGSGVDSLINRFPVTTDGAYLVRSRGFSSYTGTYDFSAYLENAPNTPAPLTGGTLAREVEPNNTAANANDASAAWRPVQYRSLTAGSVGSAAQADFFKFRFTAGDLVTFNVDSTSSLDAALTVAGPSGQPLLGADGGDDSVPLPAGNDAHVYAFIAPTTGLYVVQVRSAGGSSGSYDLDLQLSTNTAPPAGAAYAGLIGTDLAATMHGVNASAFLRVPFDFDPSALPGGAAALTLGVKYDDGFVAYLNGTEVARRNAPAGAPSWDAAATSERPDGQSVVFENIDLSAFQDLLVAGPNVLAVQGLNSSAADDDFLVFPRLLASTHPIVPDPAYFVNATPGAPNGTGALNTGPLISAVAHSPAWPADDQDVYVTAKVSAPAGSSLTAATLVYRVMYTAAVPVPLLDDGAHGDGAGGDGVFGAAVPADAARAGQMVRYYVTATDSLGRNSRAPLHASEESPQSLGYVVRNPNADGSTLPVFHFFAQDTAAARTRSGTRGSVFYDGEFYDNVFIRDRGGNTSDGFKFDFNPGYHFRWSNDPAANRVDEINVNYNSAFDETRLRAPLAFETFADAGVPALSAFPIRVQQNGSLYRMATFVENPDEDYLSRVGLGGGALYKMEFDDPQMNSAGSFSKQARRNEGSSDLQEFLDGIHLTGDARVRYLFDHFDVPQFLNYWAANTIVNDNDDVQKNYFLYRDTLGDGEWQFLPWDKDLTFGKHYGLADYGARDPQTHPFFGDSNHPKIDGPFAYNYLIDALLDTPVIKQMYLRRLRTLMDDLLQPASTPLAERKFEKRMDELFAQVTGDPAIATQMSTLRTSLNSLRDRYLQVRRNHLYVDHGTNTGYRDYAGIPAGQGAGLAIDIAAVDANPASGNQDQEYVRLNNPNAVAVDVSGWKLGGAIDYTLPQGVVIPANGSVYVARDLAAFRARAAGPGGGQGLFAVGGYDGQLSARGETLVLTDAAGRQVDTLTYDANPTAAQQAVRITEVMYHPPDAPGNTPLDEQFEYVELLNVSGDPVSLNGLKFTQGINLVLGNVTLQPGAYAVVVKNRAAFESRYGAGAANVVGTFPDDTLDNAGERLRLEDASGEVVTDFHFDSRAWYPSTDGLGRSLVVRDPSAAIGTWGDKAAWRPSGRASGSPGTSDVADSVAPTLVIQDVTPSPRSTPVDSVTLRFSEPVYGLDLSDLALVLNGLRVGLGTAQTLTASDAGATWTLGNLAPLASAGGAYRLSLAPAGSGVADYDANDLAAGDSVEWSIANPASGAAVAGRWVLYNNSSFDGLTPGAAPGDLAAVATDKQALLPGQASSFSNITSYRNGINGVLIDFAGIPPATLGPADFTFRAGSGGDVSAWAAAAAPTVTLLPSPVGASFARYALVWPDRSIRDTWLQVTVAAGARTGLAKPDVFYFGNLGGESGDTPAAATGGAPVATGARVSAQDLAAAKRSLNAASPLTGRVDFNRDGRVNAQDLAAAKSNLNRALAALTAPAAPAAATRLFSSVPLPPVSIAGATTKRNSAWEALQA